MNTYAIKVYLTAEDIYNRLSEEDQKRFNKAIITNVTRGLDMSVEIECVLVNDCSIEKYETDRVIRSKYSSEDNMIPYTIKN